MRLKETAQRFVLAVTLPGIISLTVAQQTSRLIQSTVTPIQGGD